MHTFALLMSSCVMLPPLLSCLLSKDGLRTSSLVGEAEAAAVTLNPSWRWLGAHFSWSTEEPRLEGRLMEWCSGGVPVPERERPVGVLLLLALPYLTSSDGRPDR